MELYRLTIPKDDAWRVIEFMGNKHVAHFVDLNKNEQLFNLPYAFRLKMCDETERRIQFLVNKCKEMRVDVKRPETIEEFDQFIDTIAKDRRKALNLLFDTVEQEMVDKEKFVVSQSKTIQDMQIGINKLEDYVNVLKFVSEQASEIPNANPAVSNNDLE